MRFLIYSLSLTVILFLACGKKEEALPKVDSGTTPKVPIVPTAPADPKISVALGGNAYVTVPETGYAENIDDSGVNGLSNWVSSNTIVSAYVKVIDTGTVKLYLLAKSDPGTNSEIKVTSANQSYSVRLSKNTLDTVEVGAFKFHTKGYVKIDLQGLYKSGNTFGNVAALLVQGKKVTNTMVYVKDNISSHYYWGRRGPSVHLAYQMPAQGNSEWFYNEVTIPKGSDVIGSYFMANGFSEGYFGIQVNSASERRILFSIWSPFQTDNPNSIPADQKIILERKGTNVYTGEFGNEGAGGQSYLVYNWKPETTYKFLLHGKPIGDNYTLYTAYFFAPELNKWQLIASFKRPKTQTYLKGLHSFLENFSNIRGYLTRSAEYGNAWVRSDNAVWTELVSAKFTGDDIARINYRQDLAGGVKGQKFFLQNGGFFNESVTLNLFFNRAPGNTIPNIDFNNLP